ncbi:hypothetical protein, partial [Klebsiella spallanzanii]|uniref:hypothetical protein n=1 Tax=Klebsiella spallanzanii TaxID=2587528 RepID=UPI001ABA2059
ATAATVMLYGGSNFARIAALRSDGIRFICHSNHPLDYFLKRGDMYPDTEGVNQKLSDGSISIGTPKSS